jgi:hypothetical protein
MTIWQILDIEPTQDINEIKQAYAKKIKQCKPDVDPKGFQQIRTAYELAKQYAAGLVVNVELDSEPVEETQDSRFDSYQAPDQIEEDYSSQNPEDLVIDLLDALVTSENDAIALLEEYQRSGRLDNLEFSDEFQSRLAYFLLKAIPHYNHFICYAIDFFQWQDNPEVNTNSFFGVALTNLLNQTRPYRLIQRLKVMSQIKSKQEAEQNKMDWYECEAAKTLLNRSQPWKFFFTSVFLRKKTKAILTLIKLIEEQCLQPLDQELNFVSIVWWYQHKGIKMAKIFSLIYVLAIPFIAAAIVLNSKKTNTVHSHSSAIDNQFVRSDSSSILSTTILASEGKALHGSNRYIIHIPPRTKSSQDEFWSIILYDDHYQLVANPIDRHSIVSLGPHNYNDDGSLDVYIQHTSPGQDKEANWLPAPEGAFLLMAQISWPKEAALDSSWKPPVVKLIT